MKIDILVASLLFGVSIAEDQVPLKEKAQGWFDKAKSYIPSVTPSIPNPVAAGAAYVAEKKVQEVNIRNYQRLLSQKLDGEEEWLIYTTGGNKSCFGRCGKTDLAWNESVPLLAALPQPAGAPSLHLGMIDCEKEAVLCAGWAVGCPGIYHFLVPQQSSSPAETPARFVDLNVTSTTPQDIVRLASQAPTSRIMAVKTYDGVLHPIDGLFAKAGIQQYLGYFISFMGSTPSWIIMILISFISRQFMSRKMAGGRNAPDLYGSQGAKPGAAQPAPAAAKPATPGSAGKGGKKRR